MIALFLLLVAAGSPAQETQPTVLVQVLVDTAYSDSAKSLARLDALTQLPPRVVTVPPGGSISKIAANTYGFGPSNLPASYKIIESKILQYNNLGGPEELKAGTAFVPNLPRRGLEDFNRDIAANYLPNVENLDCTQPAEVFGEHSVACGRKPRMIRTSREAAQATLININLPADQTRSYIERQPIGTDVRVFNYPLAIRLADAPAENPPAAADHTVLSTSERTQIQALLVGRTRRVPVFILDTGWPSQDAYDSSRMEIARIFDTIWTNYFKRPAPQRPVPASWSDSMKPTNPHCQYVERALAEFRALSDRVQIIYLPLTKEQDAESLLTEMLQLQYLFNAVRAPEALAIGPSDKLVAEGKKEARKVVASLQTKWSGPSVQTDKVVIDAALRMGDLYGTYNHTPFFIVESWTVPHEQYFVYYPSPLRGAVVAAAGNDSLNVNVNATMQDFVQRCVNSSDTIGVINMKREKDDLLCCSSRIDEEVIDLSMAIAFDGEVSGTGCSDLCGTSFAAPRVAWLLAGAEVLQDQAPSSVWEALLKQRLLKIRDLERSKFGKLWLDPLRLFQEASGPHSYTQD